MKTLSILLPIALVCSTATSALAQKDVITLRDGTEIKPAKVLSWNAKEIKYQTRKGTMMKPAHEIAFVSLERAEEAASQAGPGDAAALAGAADAKKKDELLASSLLYAAAMVYQNENKPSDMITALQEIDKLFPESPYAPLYYSSKIRYYISKQKPDYKSATKAAQAYGDAARTRSWSAAYAKDAEYWERRIEGLSKKVQPVTFIDNMKRLITSAGGMAPFVEHAAWADLGDVYRKQKDLTNAREAYQKLGGFKGLEADIKARMYIGLGYIALEDALAEKAPEKQKAQFYVAYKNFLKVFLNARDAHPEYVGEGLYNAAKACTQWNGLPDCRRMAGLLRGRLRLRDPYMHTSWAKKK